MWLVGASCLKVFTQWLITKRKCIVFCADNMADMWKTNIFCRGSTKLIVYYYSVGKLWGGTRKCWLFRCPKWVGQRNPAPERLNNMHLLFPSHVWRSSLCKPKRLNVCLFLGQQSVCHSWQMPVYFLALLWFICVHVVAFLFYLCSWHLSTFHCHHNKKSLCDTVITCSVGPYRKSEYGTFELSILQASSEKNKWASDALMMQMLQVLARDSMGRWFVWLTQLVMIERWWMRPSFSGNPKQWGWRRGTDDSSWPADQSLRHAVGWEIFFQQHSKNQDKRSFHRSCGD